MNIPSAYKNLFARSFPALLFFTFSFALTAQEEKTEVLKEFKILIEKTDNGIKMKSLKGSAWLDLSFSLSNGSSRVVDEYGTADVNALNPDKMDDGADFLISIEKTETGVKLQGMEGTSWINLSFSLVDNEVKAFDQYGTVTVN